MIIPALKEHADAMLAIGLRAEDVEEIAAASGATPEVALHLSLQLSTKAWAMIADYRVIAMFGVAPWPSVPELGIPWLLCTDEFPKHQKEILTVTKRIVREMGEGFQFLVNYTDVRHINNLGWLQWAGFRFDKFSFIYQRFDEK
jgi:hypothetical protein